MKRPGLLGHVDDLVGGIDQQARRRGQLKGALMRCGRSMHPAADRRAEGDRNVSHTRRDEDMWKIPLASCADNGLIDPGIAVDSAEKPGRILCRFRRAKEQIATGLQSIIECRDNLLLQLFFQINEKVAAGNEMQLGKRRIFEKAMSSQKAPCPGFRALSDNDPPPSRNIFAGALRRCRPRPRADTAPPSLWPAR